MDRDRRTIDDHLPLRPVEFHILLSLAAGERHGYGITQDDPSSPHSLLKVIQKNLDPTAARIPQPSPRRNGADQ